MQGIWIDFSLFDLFYSILTCLDDHDVQKLLTWSLVDTLGQVPDSATADQLKFEAEFKQYQSELDHKKQEWDSHLKSKCFLYVSFL